jgi:peroxiredoxin (alkyl hydroperoxide reductase subunit C)
MEGKEDMKCYDWFFCTKKLPADKVMAEIKKKK